MGYCRPWPGYDRPKDVSLVSRLVHSFQQVACPSGAAGAVADAVAGAVADAIAGAVADADAQKATNCLVEAARRPVVRVVRLLLCCCCALFFDLMA